MDLFKAIELASQLNQADEDQLEKAIQARHPETGRWVTLNGGKGEEDHHGHGTHVFIEGGRITKGPKALVERDAKKATAAPKGEPPKKGAPKAKKEEPKKEEPKQAAPNKEKTYHFFKKDKGYVPVKGRKVDIHPDLDTFLHKTENGNHAVTEAKSGASIGGSFSTEEAALQGSKKALASVGMDRLKGAIDKHVSQNGPSPRYGGKEHDTAADEAKHLERAKDMTDDMGRSGDWADEVHKVPEVRDALQAHMKKTGLNNYEDMFNKIRADRIAADPTRQVPKKSAESADARKARHDKEFEEHYAKKGKIEELGNAVRKMRQSKKKDEAAQEWLKHQDAWDEGLSKMTQRHRQEREGGDLDEHSPRAHQKLKDIENQIRYNPSESGHIVTPHGDHVWKQGGGVDYVDVSDAHRKGQLAGNILTHNHPRGSGFSPEDIQVLMAHGLKEIRATGKHYTYRMQTPDGKAYPAHVVRKMLEDYGQAHQAVRRDMQRKVNNYEITPEEASKETHHQVWSQVAPKYGLKYGRSATK